jgi:phosphoenolpyruvate---glycerone phosphotransferase subunit DhaL
VVGPEELRDAAGTVADALLAQTDRFAELDGIVGDGDLGVTLTAAAEALLERRRQPPAESPAAFFKELSSLVRANPSTFSGLVSVGLREIARRMGDQSMVSRTEWPQYLEAAITAIQARGRAELGDKTVVDALHGSLTSLTSAEQAGVDAPAAAAALAAGGREAADRLQSAPARRGRASWQGERTRGAVDPGSAVWVVTAEAIAAFVASRS